MALVSGCMGCTEKQDLPCPGASLTGDLWGPGTAPRGSTHLRAGCRHSRSWPGGDSVLGEPGRVGGCLAGVWLVSLCEPRSTRGQPQVQRCSSLPSSRLPAPPPPPGLPGPLKAGLTPTDSIVLGTLSRQNNTPQSPTRRFFAFLFSLLNKSDGSRCGAGHGGPRPSPLVLPSAPQSLLLSVATEAPSPSLVVSGVLLLQPFPGGPAL